MKTSQPNNCSQALIFICAVMMAGLFGMDVLGFGGKRPEADPKSTAILKQLEAAGELIVAGRAEDSIPLDPSSPMWKKAKKYVIPLVSQATVTPRPAKVRRLKLNVRALYTDKMLGLHLSWADRSKDENVTKPEYFRDAVAVEFPLKLDNPAQLPYIGMGNKGRPVNVWQWKASWQADIDRGFQGVTAANPNRVPVKTPEHFRIGADAGSPFSQTKRKSSVENILAEGFGTVTSIPPGSLRGKGIWKKGQWQVVITRELEVDDGQGVSFEDDDTGMTSIAFAVWNGKSEERNGSKVITRWRFLTYGEAAVPLAQLKKLTIGSVPGASAKRGKAIVKKLQCRLCHYLPGSDSPPSNPGPDLNLAGAIHRQEYLLESLKKPSAVIVPAPGYYSVEQFTSNMPGYDEQTLAASDYKHVVEYMRTLK